MIVPDITISPVFESIGTQSITGIVDSYFNAKVTVGNYSSIASVLYVHGSTEHPCVFDKKLVSTFPFGDKWTVDYPKARSKGNIEIGNDVWIGSNVTIMSGVKIGDGAIVGSNTTVSKNIPPYAVVVGNPMVIKRYRFSQETIDKLLSIKWWNWPEEIIKARIEDMKNIETFIKKYGEK